MGGAGDTACSAEAKRGMGGGRRCWGAIANEAHTCVILGVLPAQKQQYDVIVGSELLFRCVCFFCKQRLRLVVLFLRRRLVDSVVRCILDICLHGADSAWLGSAPGEADSS